jgi:acyl dehydratase
MQTITNRTFCELELGDSANLVRTLTHKDIELFAVVSGDVNPAHLDEDFAKNDIFHGVVAHGMWGGALISAVLGTELPGPGTIYLDQTLQFRRPIRIGDVVTVTLTVIEKIAGANRVILSSKATNQRGEEVITGTATVIAPVEKISRPRVLLPDVTIRENTQQ